MYLLLQVRASIIIPKLLKYMYFDNVSPSQKYLIIFNPLTCWNRKVLC